jgi:HD-GYP domain-containing protein (c-di-GMP phosphodiesterase class II)
MRRITTKYTQPGMILGMPVFDNYGKELLGRRTRLNEECMAIMAKNSVGEILIEDIRVDDVVVAPMISPEKEGKLANAFRQLVTRSQSTQSIDPADIAQVKVTVSEIARNLSLSILGEINVSCSISQDEYTYIQPVKSATLAMVLGFRLGMSTDELFILGMGTLLKDICYLFPYSGTPAEHPVQSYTIIKQLGDIKEDIAQAVLQHHEQWNGSGYPQGLKGKGISKYAQIIAAADAFSDLLVEHPEKEGCMSHEAIEYIMASSGDLFDPELVEAFVRKIPAYPNGLTVKLNSGEIGIVSDPNLGFIARPVIRICFDPEKGNLKKPYDINLARSECQYKLITKVLEYD